MNDADRKAFELYYRTTTGSVRYCEAERRGWKAACEWRDSQVGEPVAWARYPRFTSGLQKAEIVFTKPDGNDWVELHTTPPAAQINQQMLEALKDIAATGYSNIDRDKARAALAAKETK